MTNYVIEEYFRLQASLYNTLNEIKDYLEMQLLMIIFITARNMGKSIRAMDCLRNMRLSAGARYNGPRSLHFSGRNYLY